MIGPLITRIAVAVSLTAIVPGGWGGCLLKVLPAASAEASVATADQGAGTADRGTSDCHRTASTKHEPVQPCLSLCGVTVQAIPATVSRPLDFPVGEPHYPAGASLHSWLTQPDPFPPRV